MSKATITMGQSQLAFWTAIPIALLGGLMGLGGAEFRLPVLAGLLGYSARQAVPLNLAISLVTIIVSLIVRGQILSVNSLMPYREIVVILIIGAAIAAFFGATLARKISNERLEQIILVLLVAIGIALIIEGFLPQSLPAIVPPILHWQIGSGILFGVAIGLVSSLLGVAGGELIIPTLIFAFGVDIKTAGTGSLIISLPTVLVGLFRYAQQGVFRDRAPLQQTVVPMSLGSVIGAIAGGMLVGIVPAAALKIILGSILNLSAFRVFHHSRKSPSPNPQPIQNPKSKI